MDTQFLHFPWLLLLKTLSLFIMSLKKLGVGWGVFHTSKMILSNTARKTMKKVKSEWNTDMRSIHTQSDFLQYLHLTSQSCNQRWWLLRGQAEFSVSALATNSLLLDIIARIYALRLSGTIHLRLRIIPMVRTHKTFHSLSDSEFAIRLDEVTLPMIIVLRVS